MEAESQPQFDTAKPVAAGVSGPSEPKRSVGAAGKKDKKDAKMKTTFAPVQGKKPAGKNTAVTGKAKLTNKKSSPKTATADPNRGLENRMSTLETMLAKMAPLLDALAAKTGDAPTANVTERHEDYDEFDIK